jgi:hypothetical protein
MALVASAYKTAQYFLTVRPEHANKSVDDFCREVGISPAKITQREHPKDTPLKEGELLTLNLYT